MAELEFPLTELAAAAAQLHELYTAYLQAGFSEAQAFELVRSMAAAGIKQG